MLSGGPRATRPAEPEPAPPGELRVPDEVSLSPEGFLTFRVGERSSAIHLQELAAWRERCEAASCVVLAQPAVGTSWVVGARPRASGLGARWILGRPVLPLPEALALPAGLPAGEVELRVLPLLDRGVWPPAGYDDGGLEPLGAGGRGGRSRAISPPPPPARRRRTSPPGTRSPHTTAPPSRSRR